MAAIKDVLEGVILGGSMSLTQIAERIDEMYVKGRLNAQERAELVDLMHAKARPDQERADVHKRIDALAAAMAALAARVAALEGGTANGGGTNAIPAWQPWDGVSSDYAQGAMVTHKGKVWQSAYAGQNVWEPGAVGVDERYWIEVSV